MARNLLDDLVRRVGAAGDLTVLRDHFGSDKELFMHVLGHKTAVRYREF